MRRFQQLIIIFMLLVMIPLSGCEKASSSSNINSQYNFHPGVPQSTPLAGQEIKLQLEKIIYADVIRLKGRFGPDCRNDPSWWYVWPYEIDWFDIEESEIKQPDSSKTYVYSLGRKITSMKINGFHDYNSKYFVDVEFDMSDYNLNIAYIYSLDKFSLEDNPVFTIDFAFDFIYEGKTSITMEASAFAVESQSSLSSQ